MAASEQLKEKFKKVLRSVSDSGTLAADVGPV